MYNSLKEELIENVLIAMRAVANKRILAKITTIITKLMELVRFAFILPLTESVDKII